MSNDLSSFLFHERQVQKALSDIEQTIFPRFLIEKSEIKEILASVNSDISSEVRKRLIKKFSFIAPDDDSKYTITLDERRKIIARNFKNIEQLIQKVETCNVPKIDVVCSFFCKVISGKPVQIKQISDDELYQLYEFIGVIIETLEFIDEFDVILKEWTRREGIRRFSFLSPKPFINRETQINKISLFIKDFTDRPILLIHGVGGVGKTALMAQAMFLQYSNILPESLLSCYFDLDPNKFRTNLAFRVFFQAGQQIQSLVGDENSQFSEEKNKWLNKNQKIRFYNNYLDTSKVISLTREFADLLDYFNAPNQRIVFIFDSLESYLQVEDLRRSFITLLRALVDVFRKDIRFKCIVISRTSDLPDFRKSLFELLHVSDFDEKYAIDFLRDKIQEKGIEYDSIYSIVGGNPLNLKIASELVNWYKNNNNIDLKELFSKGIIIKKFRKELNTQLVRGRLYNRILDAIDKPIQPLVNPGFILRKIDIDLFNNVLYPFLQSKNVFSDINFEEFKETVSPFESVICWREDEQILTLNSEIRDIAVELMLADKPKDCQFICNLAIDYFKKKEKIAPDYDEFIKARSERIYYLLLNGEFGSKIDALWIPQCFNYISFDVLPARGKAWLATKDRLIPVFPLSLIEESGQFEQNRLLPRGARFFFERVDLAKMERYYNRMNPKLSYENSLLSCEIELAYLNFDKVDELANRNIDKNIKGSHASSLRKLLTFGTCLCKRYLLSNKYQDGFQFLNQFTTKIEIFNSDGTLVLDGSDLLNREILEFFVFAFALFAFSNSNGKGQKLKKMFSNVLETLFIEMPDNDFLSHDDLALQFLLFSDIDEPRLFERILSSIEFPFSSKSIISDLSLLKDRFLADFEKSSQQDYVQWKKLCQKLAIADQRLWSKSVAIGTFKQFNQTSNLVEWFTKWSDQYKIDSKFQDQWLLRANKGEIANEVVAIVRCHGVFLEYVLSICKISENSYMDKLKDLLTCYMENLKKFGSSDLA